MVNVRAPNGLKTVTEEPRAEDILLAVLVVLAVTAVARPACAGRVVRYRHLEKLRVLRWRLLARGEAEVLILTGNVGECVWVCGYVRSSFDWRIGRSRQDPVDCSYPNQPMLGEGEFVDDQKLR